MFRFKLLIGRINLRCVGARSRAVILTYLFVSMKERGSLREERGASAFLFCRESEVQGRQILSHRTFLCAVRSYARLSVRSSVLNSVLYFVSRDIRAIRAAARLSTRERPNYYASSNLCQVSSLTHTLLFFFLI